ncbi:protein SPMIP2 [Heteronotia binoei]|uniref:protein SPMIP2 n=1 Tax=Heteronotia binoei TaxID=13085 RepID=UPI00292FB03D|nr:protein SPMIP2 [Heteronotia binoei]
MDNSADGSQAAKGKTQRCCLSSGDPPEARDTGKRIIFTGPDGTGDYRSWLPAHTIYVGAKSSPKEGTSEAMYLWRPAPDNPPAWLKRQCTVGEIGWRVVEFGYLNRRRIPISKPIMTEIFPSPEEFEMIQRYTNPGWKKYPAPCPQVLGWEGYQNNHPSVLTMDCTHTLSPQGKECGFTSVERQERKKQLLPTSPHL